MNDIEKAIEEFKDRRGYYLDDKYRLRCYDLAISALEKQVPKKPIYHGQYFSTNYKCPVCGRLYWEKSYIGNYCDSCGQKLEVENE